MPDNIHAQRLLVDMAIEPTSKAEQEKLSTALAKLGAEDPLFRIWVDPEANLTIMRGISDDHLEGKVGILKQMGIEVNHGAPQVAFLERPTRRAEVDYTYKKTYGPVVQFAAVTLVVEPSEPDTGYQFECKVAGDTLPKEYISGIEEGIKSVLTSGVAAGFPVIDVRVHLVDGKYHDVGSSPLAFEIASRAAFREALQKAASVLLEPIMKVEVLTPKEHAKAVIDDLSLRRGKIDRDANPATINGMVPLMNMFGYASALRRMSMGRATFTMQFDHYAPAGPLPEDGPPFRPAIGMRA